MECVQWPEMAMAGQGKGDKADTPGRSLLATQMEGPNRTVQELPEEAEEEEERGVDLSGYREFPPHETETKAPGGEEKVEAGGEEFGDFEGAGEGKEALGGEGEGEEATDFSSGVGLAALLKEGEASGNIDMDQMESMFAEIGRVRHAAKGLPDEERRRRAGMAAMNLMDILGGGEEDSDAGEDTEEEEATNPTLKAKEKEKAALPEKQEAKPAPAAESVPLPQGPFPGEVRATIEIESDSDE